MFIFSFFLQDQQVKHIGVWIGMYIDYVFTE